MKNLLIICLLFLASLAGAQSTLNPQPPIGGVAVDNGGNAFFNIGGTAYDFFGYMALHSAWFSNAVVKVAPAGGGGGASLTQVTNVANYLATNGTTPFSLGSAIGYQWSALTGVPANITAWAGFSPATYTNNLYSIFQPAGSYLTGNQTITLGGVAGGSGATSITVTTNAAWQTDVLNLISQNFYSYLTGNQTITLSGVASGSGTTSITVSTNATWQTTVNGLISLFWGANTNGLYGLWQPAGNYITNGGSATFYNSTFSNASIANTSTNLYLAVDVHSNIVTTDNGNNWTNLNAANLVGTVPAASLSLANMPSPLNSTNISGILTPVVTNIVVVTALNMTNTVVYTNGTWYVYVGPTNTPTLTGPNLFTGINTFSNLVAGTNATQDSYPPAIQLGSGAGFVTISGATGSKTALTIMADTNHSAGGSYIYLNGHSANSAGYFEEGIGSGSTRTTYSVTTSAGFTAIETLTASTGNLVLNKGNMTATTGFASLATTTAPIGATSPWTNSLSVAACLPITAATGFTVFDCQGNAENSASLTIAGYTQVRVQKGGYISFTTITTNGFAHAW